MDIIKTLAQELNIRIDQVEATVGLMDEGCTVPFIARYRKEITGGLDDVVIRNLEDRLKYLRNMDARRDEISKLIEAQGKLTDEITLALNNATTLVELEDIYRPYRPKRKTRASVARQKGLEPLAELIMQQADVYTPSIEVAAEAFINLEEEDKDKRVASVEEAIQGAKDIIAEDIANDAEHRKALRVFMMREGSLTTKGTTEEPSVYADYYDYTEPIPKLKGHRVLAINRGEKEEFLKVSLAVDANQALAILGSRIITNKNSPAVPYLNAIIEDSYTRLLFPSMETEIRNDLFDQACEGALVVFQDNLKHLLMVAPIKGKTVLGYDPGFRTGCKLAVVDPTGKVLKTAVIYPTDGPKKNIEQSAKTVMELVRKYNVDVISIGNGTASRESESFIVDTLGKLKDAGYTRKVCYTIVSEAGASVYSASKLGQEEFPDFDVTERSAVSIGRRLQDPLAELVKIEPQAIGVGQYQHDMKQARLEECLGGVVEDCVNTVGVDLNTASYSLLSYVSGISAKAAKSIVRYREENGEFLIREELHDVPNIGPKAYEQCAGFLRIIGGDEVLDSTGVHPESYELARKLLERFKKKPEDVGSSNMILFKAEVEKVGYERLAKELGCGVPTLEDIVKELVKPGRDIRDDAPAPVLRTDVLHIEDLKEGMIVTGTVRNVVDFGCFVDIGVHQDGLLHISQMCDHYIKHPSEVLKIGDVIDCRIISISQKKDPKSGRDLIKIGLSRRDMKQ